MRYRLEDANDYISIKHVETDLERGYVNTGEFVHPGHRGTFHGCRIFNRLGKEMMIVTTFHHSYPMQCAPVAAAGYDEDTDYSDLNGATWNDHNDRVERRLGVLLADVALTFARAFCEVAGSSLTAETRDDFAASLAELAALWEVSRVGCFNAETRMNEPYFANPLPLGPRLTFSGAAQAYGMQALRERHPDLTDAERQKVLSWVLQWLQDVLSN